MPEEPLRRPVNIVAIAAASPQPANSADNDFAALYAWQWHVKSNSFHWCGDHPQHSNRLDRDRYDGIDAFLQLVSAQDRDSVAQNLTDARSGTSIARDVMLQSKDGKAFRVRLKILPICDRSSQVVSVLGLCYAESFPAEGLTCKRATLLAQAEEIARFGTWEFDAESREATLSPHLARMLGIAPETRLSEEQYWKKIHSADRASILESVTSAVAASAPFQYVARYFPPKGSTQHHFVRGFPEFDRNGRLRSIVGIIFDFSDQNHVEGELHRLSQKLLRTRDEERRTMARELHEATGQTLAAVKMSLGRLREVLPEGNPQLQGLLQSTVELAENAIREVRTVSYLMHPPMLDEAGLRSAVNWYAKGFTERSGIPIQVVIPEGFGRYGQEVEITLFRIVQEALTNIHRYSGSRTATIRLIAEDGLVHATVEDDGCGLPALGPAHGRDFPLGVGIVAMQERVKQLNGTLEIYSAPGRGTAIRATLPLSSNSRCVRTKRPNILQD